MSKKFKLLALLMLVGITSTIILTSWKQPDLTEPPNCENQPKTYGKISINFNAGPNQFRNSGYEYYIPTPDMRFGNMPGQNTFDQTKFSCTVSITSSSCKTFQWHKSFENATNIMDIELPPAGNDITIKVTYIERGEDWSTADFNKPVYFYGQQLNYSRVKFQFQQNFQGWIGSNVVQPIFLSPTEQQGYHIDPASGKIQAPLGSKADLQDISGINSYIDLSGLNSN